MASYLFVLPGCDDVVGPEGMEKFCEDIGVEPENVRVLYGYFGVFILSDYLLGFCCSCLASFSVAPYLFTFISCF